MISWHYMHHIFSLHAHRNYWGRDLTLRASKTLPEPSSDYYRCLETKRMEWRRVPNIALGICDVSSASWQLRKRAIFSTTPKVRPGQIIMRRRYLEDRLCVLRFVMTDSCNLFSGSLMLKVNVIWIPDIKACVNVALSINLEGNILSYFF